MENLLIAGISAAVERGVTPVILVFPTPIRREMTVKLLAHEEVAGVVLPSNDCNDFPNDSRIGRISEKDGNWELPNVRAQAILLFGEARLLGVRRAWRAIRHQIRTAFYVDSLGTWNRFWLPRFVLIRGARRIAGLVVRRINRVSVYRLVSSFDFILLRALERRLRDRRPMPLEHFTPSQVLLVNTSLAPGGAERQLVYTAAGLADRGLQVSVICNDLSSDKGHDFYRAHFPDEVLVHQIRGIEDLLAGGSRNCNEAIRGRLVACGLDQRIRGLPTWVQNDLLNFAAEFMARRPQVAHLWQDYTNVIAGLAACFVGVPRIVLGMRNMAAYRFPYIQPFMRAAYKALAAEPSIVFVNNSAAGAADYAAWLGISTERFVIIRNGIDETGMCTASPEDIQQWRCSLGLPDGAYVVGSVFRFYGEKQPELWVRSAAEIARRRPDVVFLLVGWGPMQKEIQVYATKAGIMDRLFMPGPQRDVRSVVSCMDVFLLTSRVEGTPNVLIEAQMMGIPVVTTAAGGSAETVEHGRTGWVVPRNEAAALADRVLAILNDRDWTTKARARAPIFIAERFGLRRMLDDTLETYGPILASQETG